jgi:hypothetical protein
VNEADDQPVKILLGERRVANRVVATERSTLYGLSSSFPASVFDRSDRSSCQLRRLLVHQRHAKIAPKLVTAALAASFSESKTDKNVR